MSQANTNDSTNISQFNKFLNNNTQFIKKKYHQHFQFEITIAQLKAQKNTDKALDFIYDVFNLHKYQNKPQLKNFLESSLTKNVNNFVQQTLEKNKQREKEKFDANVSTQLLKYCIQKNDIFAVNYDKTQEKGEKGQKVQKIEKQQILENNKIQNQKQQNADKDDNTQQKLQQKQSVQNVQQNQEYIKEQLQNNQNNKQSDNKQKSQQNNDKQPQKILLNNKKTITSVKTVSLSGNNSQLDSFQNFEKLTYQKDSQTIRKHLKVIFQFYCKQQQSINPKSTFDSINHKCQTMNIGKFITFAHATKILSQNAKQIKIDKIMIVSLFKKISEGRRQIDFHHFQTIIQNLSKKDQNIFKKMGIGGSKGKTQILKRLKDISFPFYTRDKQTRQTVPIRQFVHKLTEHSGKIQQSLKHEVMLKRQKLYGDTLNKQVLKLNGKQDSNTLKFISKLIKYDDNDKIFLKQYQIKDKSQQNIYSPINIPKSMMKRYSDIQQNDDYNFIDKKSSRSMNKGKKQEQLVLPSINNKDRNKSYLINQSTIKKQKF